MGSLSLVVILTIAATTAPAVFESNKLGMGSKNDVNDQQGFSPTSWLIGHITLWIFAYPAYLYCREFYGKKNLLIIGLIGEILFLVAASYITYLIQIRY